MNKIERGLIKRLLSEYKPWVKTLTKKEKSLIKKYTYNSFDYIEPNKFYQRLNKALREDYNGHDKDKLLSYAEIISRALSKQPLQSTITCYRSIDTDLSSKIEVNDVFTFSQFLSTSVVEEGALRKRYKYVIVAVEGTKGAYIEEISHYPKQHEFLFDKDCKYKCIDKQDNVIYLEVIL